MVGLSTKSQRTLITKEYRRLGFDDPRGEYGIRAEIINTPVGTPPTEAFVTVHPTHGIVWVLRSYKRVFFHATEQPKPLWKLWGKQTYKLDAVSGGTKPLLVQFSLTK
jgi:hypothetical protein